MSYVGAPVRINNTIWRTNNTLRPLADLGLRGIWVHAEHLVMGLLCAFVACAPPCLLLLSQRPGACVFVFVRVCVRVCVHVCVCVCVCVSRVWKGGWEQTRTLGQGPGSEKTRSNGLGCVGARGGRRSSLSGRVSVTPSASDSPARTPAAKRTRV